MKQIECHYTDYIQNVKKNSIHPKKKVVYEDLLPKNLADIPNIIFYGPPGTGKTSTIVACAKKMYGPAYKSMALELNASDDRGIDVVRDQIKNFAGTRKLFSTGVKLVILDEADAMTSSQKE